jgi:DNA-binding PucR family transcriptional regulator
MLKNFSPGGESWMIASASLLERAPLPLSRADLRLGERRVAVGQVGAGLAGFRRSHRQARAVEELLTRRPERTGAVIAHADVELPALLTTDLAAAREFVARHLGPLAKDDPRMHEIRETLRCYLDHERSTAKVAAEQHISRNTVTYRVQQAMRLCGYPQETSPLRLHAALSIVDWLSGADRTHQGPA